METQHKYEGWVSCELQDDAKAFNQMEESDTVEIEVQADLNMAKECGNVVEVLFLQKAVETSNKL